VLGRALQEIWYVLASLAGVYESEVQLGSVTCVLLWFQAEELQARATRLAMQRKDISFFVGVRSSAETRKHYLLVVITRWAPIQLGSRELRDTTGDALVGISAFLRRQVFQMSINESWPLATSPSPKYRSHCVSQNYPFPRSLVDSKPNFTCKSLPRTGYTTNAIALLGWKLTFDSVPWDLAYHQANVGSAKA
jgi:hypothetical protein